MMRLVFLQLYSSILSFLLLPRALGTYLKRRYFMFTSTSALVKTNPHAAGLQSVTGGDHTFYNCNARSGLLIYQLQRLRASLEPALHDLDNPSSSPAFKAFFKDIDHAPFVRRVLENITTGAPTSTVDGSNITPSFVCLDGPGQLKTTDGGIDLYTRCSDQQEDGGDGLVASAMVESPDKPLVAICPSFFRAPFSPQRINGPCLKLHGGYFTEDGSSLVDRQMWILMHELAHFYLFWGSGARLDFYAVQECLALKKNKTVENVASYVFYAASEFHSSSSLQHIHGTIRGSEYCLSD